MTDEFNRYYIKIRVILGIDSKTTFNELTQALGPDALSYPMVRKWAKRFREGREDVSDDPRSGRPISIFTDENIERVRQVIEDDPHSTYDDITVEIGLSRAPVGNKVFLNVVLIIAAAAEEYHAKVARIIPSHSPIFTNTGTSARRLIIKNKNIKFNIIIKLNISFETFQAAIFI
ncbi:unnamed protein product [Rotaria sp. Silwood1]|nr:unnamed protein product [Rotaria sp. Silwood1]